MSYEQLVQKFEACEDDADYKKVRDEVYASMRINPAPMILMQGNTPMKIQAETALKAYNPDYDSEEEEACTCAAGGSSSPPPPPLPTLPLVQKMETAVKMAEAGVYEAKEKKAKHLIRYKEVQKGGWGPSNMWGKLNQDNDLWRQKWRGDWDTENQKLQDELWAAEKKLKDTKRKAAEAAEPQELKRVKKALQKEEDAERSRWRISTYETHQHLPVGVDMDEMPECPYCDRYVKPEYYIDEQEGCKFCSLYPGADTSGPY